MSIIPSIIHYLLLLFKILGLLIVINFIIIHKNESQLYFISVIKKKMSFTINKYILNI